MREETSSTMSPRASGGTRDPGDTLISDGVCCLFQPCPTPCDPMDCSPPGSSVHGDSPGKHTGVGCHALLQGIFTTQGSNPGLLCLLHWQQILYHWHHLAPRTVREATSVFVIVVVFSLTFSLYLFFN